MEENQDVKIARLEEGLKGLKEKVDEIKDNHLMHIAEDIGELREKQIRTDLKIAYWSGGVGAILAILQIVLKFIN